MPIVEKDKRLALRLLAKVFTTQSGGSPCLTFFGSQYITYMSASLPHGVPLLAHRFVACPSLPSEGMPILPHGVPIAMTIVAGP